MTTQIRGRLECQRVLCGVPDKDTGCLCSGPIRFRVVINHLDRIFSYLPWVLKIGDAYVCLEYVKG